MELKAFVSCPKQKDLTDDDDDDYDDDDDDYDD
jgi:hypothetical protein